MGISRKLVDDFLLCYPTDQGSSIVGIPSNLDCSKMLQGSSVIFKASRIKAQTESNCYNYINYINYT
jgi:hypothetical protein